MVWTGTHSWWFIAGGCLLLVGCLGLNGGTGGTGGIGGTGGAEMASLRAAHLAVEVPSADNTALDFNILGEGSFVAVPFANVTENTPLFPDVYVVEVTPAGAPDEVLSTVTPRLAVGASYTLVAYRDPSQEGSLSIFVFEDLGENEVGQVAFGHGVDDSNWSTISVVNADTEDILAEDLLFGTQVNLGDAPQGRLSFGFDVSPPPSAIDDGPYSIDVEPDSYTIIVPVDNDVVDGSVDSAVYAVDRQSIESISPLPSTSP
jgi:hypothetical protein